jgi:hypothetical protein|tara:strand:+ start:136 stop:351 length:216 start_codon:yes stop_codon:yes gene_type:complete
MKTFLQIRTIHEVKNSHGELIKKFKVGKHSVEIQKDDKNKFHVHIDGDMLDKYLTQAQAERMAKEFIKQAG